MTGVQTCALPIFPIGTLDASVRLVRSLLQADGVTAGREAATLVDALYLRPPSITRAKPREV